jgi:hypothetical protein
VEEKYASGENLQVDQIRKLVLGHLQDIADVRP